MDYVLGQYSRSANSAEDYMTLQFAEATAERHVSDPVDASQQSTSPIDIFTFEDEYLFLGENNHFEASTSTNYYFHGKIKQDINSVQVIYIYLAYNDPKKTSRQYIKTITINQDTTEDSNGWFDIEFIFTPLQAYDSILFKLKRELGPDTGSSGARKVKIAYEEISVINNAINRIAEGVKFIKLGVQSRPGLMMCINGEEIRTCRTGIYELKNGVITVSFFSVVNGAKETGTDMSDYMERVNSGLQDTSQAFLGANKMRPLDSFALDYMYKKKS